jgi:hypothetical protein
MLFLKALGLLPFVAMALAGPSKFADLQSALVILDASVQVE